MDTMENTYTAEDRAADRAETLDDRAHEARELRIGHVVGLARTAMEHVDLMAADVPAFLRDVHATLVDLGAPAKPVEPEAPTVEPLKPAVPVKKSVTDDHLVSLIDGSKLQMLGRHLTKHGYTPESYRAAFGLPETYPMVAPAYAKKRAEMAKTQGFGNRPTKATPAAAAA